MLHYLTLEDHQIAYRRYGNGPGLLIGWHGFGRDSSAFASWESVLGNEYTLLAVDLPFHGQTHWATDRFSQEDVAQVIKGLHLEGGGRDYHLIGHSLGGRLVGATLGKLEHPPAALWLLAPDGLATNQLATAERIPSRIKSWLGGHLSRRHEQWLSWARNLHRRGWLNGFTVQYLEYQLATPERRKRLSGVWSSLASFPLSPTHLAAAAEMNSTALHVVFGRHDPVIDGQRAAALLADQPSIQVHYLAQGHRLLTTDTARWWQREAQLLRT